MTGWVGACGGWGAVMESGGGLRWVYGVVMMPLGLGIHLICPCVFVLVQNPSNPCGLNLHSCCATAALLDFWPCSLPYFFAVAVCGRCAGPLLKTAPHCSTPHNVPGTHPSSIDIPSRTLGTRARTHACTHARTHAYLDLLLARRRRGAAALQRRPLRKTQGIGLRN